LNLPVLSRVVWKYSISTGNITPKLNENPKNKATMMDAQMHTSHDQGLSTSFLQTVLKERLPNLDIGSLFWLPFFFRLERNKSGP